MTAMDVTSNQKTDSWPGSDIAKKLNWSHDHSKEGSVAIIIISIYYRNITIISIGGFIA